MAEDPQPMSIQARIAALNHAHVGRAPGDTDHSIPRMKPVVPSRPAIIQRQKTTNIPPADIIGSVTKVSIGNEPSGARQNGYLPPPVITRTGQKPADTPKPAPPPLPRRQPTQPSPVLPPRRPSEASLRRDSIESTNSAISSISGLSIGNGTAKTPISSRSPSIDAKSRLKAPAWGDATLPPLPPLKRDNTMEKARVPLKPTKSTPNIIALDLTSSSSSVSPSLPPRLPPRKQSNEDQTSQPASQPPRKLPVPLPKLSALSFGLNTSTEDSPAPKERPNGDILKPQTNGLTNGHIKGLTNGFHHHDSDALPSPVPKLSRPDLSTLLASKPKVSPPPSALAPTRSNICLTCRDFSAPDNHAAQFPRQSLGPRPDLANLAYQLTAPFPSDTDKARAIFTWLHHNIAYDVDAFFSNNLKPSTPSSTASTGLAVCEGYAGLFTALATYAGLQSLTVSGHGKGYGHVALAPGAPVPPFESNHAWNVVQIDDGQWKLLDACWGAGDVSGAGKPYNKNFKPQFFTMTNDEFGKKHYPTNKNHFYRDDGRPSIPWDEYILQDPDKPNGVENLTVFSNTRGEYGVGDETFLPRGKHIAVHSPPSRTHFQFSLLCPHWTLERTGKGLPPVFILIAHGIDGRKDEYIPFEHGKDAGGDFWSVDVDTRALGAPGQKLTLFAVSSFDGREGRGISVREFREKVGRCGMGFQGVAEWVLV